MAGRRGKRHRYEQARELKRGDLLVPDVVKLEPCAECGAPPGQDHASWCLAEELEDEFEDDDASDDGQDGDDEPGRGLDA